MVGRDRFLHPENLTNSMNPKDAIRMLPKAELHIHLLGSVRPTTLLEFMRESGIGGKELSESDIRRMFQFRDFPHFIEVYKSIIDYVKDEAYFERIAFEMLEDCAASNVQYIEVSFSAIEHIQVDLDYHLMIDAIRKGLVRAEQSFNIKSDIRIDLVRHSDLETAMGILNLIEEDPEKIVSIDIGGSEHTFPPGPFADVYKRAQEMGLHLVAHAGEAAGPESVWDAIRLLDVERIGHGVSARDDPVLMEYIKDRGIVVEACPVSNLRTGVVSSIAEHPVREFYDRGIIVTANSDDPSLFNTTINNEYLQLHEHLNFTLEELFDLSLNAVNTAFIDDSVKTKLRESFKSEYLSICEKLA